MAQTLGAVAPLEDPAYEPEHPPVGGGVPAVVARWGARSQVRWFTRFWRELRFPQDLSGFWVFSEHHRGPCCLSCESEFLDGFQGGGLMADGWCCCHDSRIGA
ncbi:hypothetical protein ABZY09_30670 [Streptomyces sp. NPDC002928]|uniref:hypothetical protein n=1 Tax=Streptomyces sp. NPDC002928 TaxID=3154440 RepID=UPI0033A9ABB5